jgi:heme/copper-type cytochrome/quinol oxidase subunit 1
LPGSCGQLAQPDELLTPAMYDQLFSMHAITMIFRPAGAD